ncbi:UDP-N-acetylglucosamine--N-acetylmuramyl-(pentapeptide) pyrophosphoryl-undecaprenol N-acetylglucosamine transferase [Sulfurimonas denitrificans DSM 1251]|uniref:UDP-N-acetylglucosamine--N-acetylmuramyl-(pentapeptide) pyrophosphoryl-undecaprenol N-acetylglucosamine transferase n=1 Tax=Sulfurimonas denitrificans (strain ATCC 33889 / DSM 1251) TaxID=326298 RepID=MURG_SULDN|nr:undecaprenyldiphospho-muramoylpentapeptide beta-N-acetylglucosaminyltransferase [Sulfurimonas denitrificans]Q30PK0.1 RecName: Full=UDP-N-acetylglucosamine--N-acetylmuramyl-(pentapeptide) pyrophosphoryl-undecaprenol N-acetylglucosamine transferase; AltName: Full=Undecaprenyl-PP-MurNAc-pentapeptide-UDPGlcNAc GlcNAc transferase [Sulfurimonas denitrificans DSM 1251]ABB45081.1 UDP-N-acetylglucosamine--N-acetylmuramyl-(pentapeptide) pyrophosphoryl-undecaprenol N-acetylglucosamine transferase [Sulfur
MRLCITGGGTGGHLMIAEALVEACANDGHEAIFIGSTSGQDRKYFEQNSKFSHVYFLQTTGVVNQRGLGKLKALWLVLRAFFASRAILKKHNIQATYSVGGFSAAAASFASLSRLIPLFIHEQNAVYGKLNSILKPFATRFISAYDEASPIKGYPVKDIFFKNARLRDEIKCVIFLGGSQGAKAINDLALSVALELEARGVKIIHQAGERDYERVKSAYEELGVKAELCGFTKEMPSLMARADLAVSRSGASTLWELCANALPSFFIPFPHAASDHQYHNAKFIVDNELGWCQREEEDLRATLLSILPQNLADKSKALMEYSSRDVAKKMITDVVMSLNA